MLLEAGPYVAGGVPGAAARGRASRPQRLGVDVRTSTPRHARGRRRASRQPGSRIEAATILWAAGVAASPLGTTLGVPLDRAGRVLVNADLSIPGHPEVFVIGDLASLKGPDGKLYPGVAQVAMQMGAHAVRNILRQTEGQPTRPFVYRDLGNMATIGRAAAVADFGWMTLHGLIGWLAWLFVHIFNLIGFRNRVLVMSAVGLVVHHLSTIGPADHGRRSATAHDQRARAARRGRRGAWRLA